VAADEQGRFTLWNPAADKILGAKAHFIPTSEWPREYGLYQADGETLCPADRVPLFRAIHGEASSAEMLVRHPELPPRWIEVSARPMLNADGAVCGGVAAFRDITARKAAEAEIKKLNNELEHRVLQRTAELEAANQELEAFTYSVSHDLRAPLRHIGGFSKLLMEEHGPKLDSEAQHYLQRIEEGTHRMGQLVDELLNLARVGRHAISLQVTGLDSILQEVVTILKSEYEGREVKWQIGTLPFVECDPTLLKQVFQNLLSNALKFTRPRSQAVIEVGYSEHNGVPTIMVRDNGVGFSMKYADKLFGVFQRLHRAEDFEGTGVGLATVQRIVQKHGGCIWAEAELEKGAAFYFTLGNGAANGTDSGRGQKEVGAKI
jgi:light-regulated signal transduction histidine kinase (bacteriophytochrome)